jgi:hypothetical protein
MNSEEQKFDIDIGDISVDMDQTVIHTIVKMTNLIGQLQVPIFAVVVSNVCMPF